jgi:hypothetical protein
LKNKVKVKTKIYEDGEWTTQEECFRCKGTKGVFYDKSYDVFTHTSCLREFEEECNGRKQN